MFNDIVQKIKCNCKSWNTHMQLVGSRERPRDARNTVLGHERTNSVTQHVRYRNMEPLGRQCACALALRVAELFFFSGCFHDPATGVEIIISSSSTASRRTARLGVRPVTPSSPRGRVVPGAPRGRLARAPSAVSAGSAALRPYVFPHQ
jgi:hypothetical protein